MSTGSYCVTAGAGGLREGYLSASTANPPPRGRPGPRMEEWGTLAARSLRRDLLWAYFEGTAYDKFHYWAETYKKLYALYEPIRHVFSCASRLGGFWETHTWGGSLDPAMGDGRHVPTALPVVMAEEKPAVRAALARLLRDSRWQERKDRVALYGATMGDVAIKVCDDPARGKVYLEAVDPRHLADATWDRHGAVTSYTVERWVRDPRDPEDVTDPTSRVLDADRRPLVKYVEEAELLPDGGGVRYRTYLGDEPYAWDDHPGGPEWVERYPFVPLVTIPHWDVGLHWGWAEVQPVLSKLREADNGPSALMDFIVKSVDPIWLYAGIDPAGVSTLEMPAGQSPERPGPYENPRAGRYDQPALWGPPEARAQALIAGLDVNACRAFFADLREDLEDEYPELVRESKLALGDASGRALRYARGRIETKAIKRRAGYDMGFVRAAQMALTIGGMRGYEGYRDFDAGSYDRGDLDFAVGPRSVFGVDVVDDMERKELFFKVMESAVRAGYPPERYLRDAGYTDSEIAAFMAERDAESARMVALAQAQAALRQPNPVNNAPKQAPPNGEAARQAVQRPGGM